MSIFLNLPHDSNGQPQLGAWKMNLGLILQYDASYGLSNLWKHEKESAGTISTRLGTF